MLVGRRPQRHGQDHALQGDHGPRAQRLGRRSASSARSLSGRTPAEIAAHGHRLRAAGAAALAVADGRRAPALVENEGRRLEHRAHLRDLPAAGRAEVERRRAALGRRAADARHLAARCWRTRGCWSWTSPPRASPRSSSRRWRRCCVRLGEEGDIDVLVIEQNIGVACAVADRVAIMVNGRINRIVPARELAADRDLQQRLLGVGRHAHDDTPAPAAAPTPAPGARGAARRRPQPAKVYMSQPEAPDALVAAGAACRSSTASRARCTTGVPTSLGRAGRRSGRSQSAGAEPSSLVAGTLDTKGDELRFMRDLIRAAGLPVRMVDLSTSGKPSRRRRARRRGRGHPPARRGGRVHRRPRQSVAGMARGLRSVGCARQEGLGAASSRPAARAAPRSSRRRCARCRSACRS